MIYFCFGNLANFHIEKCLEDVAKIVRPVEEKSEKRLA
jgi:hypothetical protein